MTYTKFSFLLSTLLVLTGCSTLENDLTKGNLKGRVNKLVESRYSAIEKFGELSKDTLERTTILTYNDKGFLVEEFEKGFNGFSDRTEKYEYNKNGKLSKITAFDPKGNSIQSYLLDYDEKDNLIKWRNISAEQKILQYETYKYDEKGYLIESVSYKEDGSVSKKCSYKNDNHGNCVEKNFYEGNNIVETHKNKYNSQNKRTENEMLMYNSTFAKSLYEYDNGELVVEKACPSIYQPDTTIWKYEYRDIDKKGNWTTKVLHWTQGKRNAVGITQRQIVYFN